MFFGTESLHITCIQTRCCYPSPSGAWITGMCHRHNYEVSYILVLCKTFDRPHRELRLSQESAYCCKHKNPSCVFQTLSPQAWGETEQSRQSFRLSESLSQSRWRALEERHRPQTSTCVCTRYMHTSAHNAHTQALLLLKDTS